MPAEGRQPPAVEIRDLWLSLPGASILEGIDLTVEQGGFLGIIGPNGGGKTMLLKVILGLVRPDRGSVRIFGRSPRAMRGRIAYVPQYTRFDPGFPIRVLDVVRMGRLGRARMFRPYDAADRSAALAALDRLEIRDLARRQVGRLSGGQLQRVLIARALAMEAPMILLDEPVASLDPGIGGRLYALLAELSRRMTVVLVDHDVGVMSRYVRSVACLNRRLHDHGSGAITPDLLDRTYGFPVGVLSHDHPPSAPDGDPR